MSPYSVAVCLYRVEGLGSNRKTGFKLPVSGSHRSMLVRGCCTSPLEFILAHADMASGLKGSEY